MDDPEDKDEHAAQGEPEGSSFMPTLPGRDAFDELLQSWLQEDDPGLSWSARRPAPEIAATDRQQARLQPTAAAPPRAPSLPPRSGETSPEVPEEETERAASRSAGSQRMMTRSQLRAADPASSGAELRNASEVESEEDTDRSNTMARSLAKMGVSAVTTVTKPVGKLMGEFRSGVKRTFKRSKTAEERAERIKDRNRRAQKAFRERQKALSTERTMSYKMLEASLEKTAAEKDALAAKIKELEGDIQEDEGPLAGLAVGMDETCPVSVTVDEAAPMEYSADDLREMGFESIAAIYKAYVDALERLLPMIRGQEEDPPNEPTMERIQTLLEELSALSISLCSLNPSEFSKLQVANLAHGREERPPDAHWAQVLEKMRLSDQQARAILDQRHSYLVKLRPILKQRWDIHTAQVRAFPKTKSGNLSAAELDKSRETVRVATETLLRNLKEEQAIKISTLCFRQQRITSKQQKAVKIVNCWPWYADSLSLSNVLARIRGEPSVRQLLEIESLPPI